jgi:hypothetical protein
MLHEGRALALDRPVALQESLEGSMLSLRTDRPRIARDLLRRAGGVRSATLFGDALHALLEVGADAQAPVRVLTEAGVTVLDVDTVQPSLEDLFIHLVGSEAGHVLPDA